MSTNKHIPQDRWLEFFDQLTNGNKGRQIKLEIFDQDIGDQIPVESAQLWSLVYDPMRVGNNLTLEIGRDEVSYAHTINNLSDVWERQDENGKAVALEVLSEDGTQNIISFF
jgi:Family of unknown function (DUF5335)